MARGKLDHLLPAPERERAAADACAQLDALIAAFDKARASAAKDEIASVKIVSALLRTIQTRLDLKYPLEMSLRTSLATFLLNLYYASSHPSREVPAGIASRRMSLPLKTRVLSIVARLIKKNAILHGQTGSEGSTSTSTSTDSSLGGVYIDWECLWEEMMTLCTRSKKYAHVCAESVLARHLETLTLFLHETRCHISAEEASAIASRALVLLADVRDPACVEGALLLVVALPTAFPGYTDVLSTWVAIWTKLPHNLLWDACWLTMLCRARKDPIAARSYDWAALTPFLLSKTKQLLALPETTGGNMKLASAHRYPVTMPMYYACLSCTSPFDSRKTALHKVAKLLYFQSFAAAMQTSDPKLVTADPLPLSIPFKADPFNGETMPDVPGINAQGTCFEGARDLVAFYSSIRVYFHPSNTGSWSQDLGFLLGTQVGELARHVGREIALCQAPGLPSSDPLVTAALPLHVPTMQYLIGVFSSLVMEMLYSKNSGLQQIASACLKSLAPLSQTVSELVVPFFISALDPAAVSKSHLAPPAMSALRNTFKALLYPSPVILKYLPTLMRLSLPGIDPNDSKKSVVTLQMYTRILQWIPIRSLSSPRSSASTSFPPTFMELTAARNFRGDAGSSPKRSMSSEEYAALLDDVNGAMVDWSARFMDKLLALLEATEDSKAFGSEGGSEESGKSERRPKSERVVAAAVGECLEAYFAALDDATALEVSVKLLSHLKTSTASPAAKDFAMILELMVAAHPNVLLGPTVSALLDSTVTSGSCSSEKLAFRLRLLGGAVRRATGAALLQRPSVDAPCVAEVIRSTLTEALLITHTESSVRTAARKLLRDVLRGMGGVYTLPGLGASESTVLGTPCQRANTEINWHVPEAAAVSAVVSLLQHFADASAKATESVANDWRESTSARKQLEESLLAHLEVIRACVRGAADLLGDTFVPTAQFPSYILDTGRSAVAGNAGDLAYLSSFRDRMLQSLNKLHDILYPGGEERMLKLRYSSADALKSISEASGAPTAATQVYSTWLRIVEAILVSRTAFALNFKQMRQMHSYHRRQGSSATARYAKKYLDLISKRETSGAKLLGASDFASPAFWDSYDASYAFVAERAVIYHAMRAKEMSIAVIRAREHAFGEDNEGPISPQEYNGCFNRIVSLCGHPFDTVRRNSWSFFQKLCGAGWKNDVIVEKLLDNLSDAFVPYEVADGSLYLLSCPYVMKRLVATPRLCGRFLTIVARSPIGTANIADPSHRETIGDKFAQLFVQYLDFWNQMPLSQLPTQQGQTTSPSELEEISKILRSASREALQMQPGLPEKLVAVFAATATNDVSGDNAGFGLNELSGIAASIRHELYIAFIILHITGHTDVDMNEDAWMWALQSVCTRRGHPVMQLGAATLTRLAYSAAISVAEQSAGTGAPFLQMPKSIVSLLQNTSLWGFLLEGLARDRTVKSSAESGGGGSAQWSAGVDRMLRAADYIQQGFPRWISSIGYQHRSLSMFSFKTHHAGLFMCLLLSIPQVSLNADFVSAILDASKTIPSTNEDEAVGNNTLRAELFGGICRIVQSGYQSLGLEHRARLDGISNVLISYLSEQVQSISFAYCKDWADAVIFGFSASPVTLSAKEESNAGTNVSDFLFQKFSSVLSELSSTASEQAEAASPDGASADEGFARHAKYILLFKALVSADLSYASTVHSTDVGRLSSAKEQPTDMEVDGGAPKLMSYRQHHIPSCDVAATAFRLRHNGGVSGERNTSSSVAVRVVDLLLQSGSTFVSPYRAVRVEMADLLDLLTDAHLDRPTEDLHLLVTRLEDIIKQCGGVLGSEDGSSAITEGVKKSSAAHWATELAASWLENASGRIVFRNSAFMSSLVQIVAVGSASADIELAKICQRTLILSVMFTYRDCCDNAAKWNADSLRGSMSVRIAPGQPDALSTLLAGLGQLVSTKQSWRIKQNCLLCLCGGFFNNWACMDIAERKGIKDIFNAALFDPKPEIQAIARAGLVAYLMTKSLSELASLAAAYQKNNDIFAAREKRKRLLAATSAGAAAAEEGADNKAAIDPAYVTTIMMSVCIISTFPYDLPRFVPGLLASLVRHMSHPFFHDALTRTIQDFKRTHQDRWEEEFKATFTAEQLAELEGAGAAHYFA